MEENWQTYGIAVIAWLLKLILATILLTLSNS